MEREKGTDTETANSAGAYEVRLIGTMGTVELRRSSRRAVHQEEKEFQGALSPGKTNGQSAVKGDLSLKDLFQEGMESIAVHRCVHDVSSTELIIR